MSEAGPTTLNDRYEMQQRIGRGGMADVYLARDLLLDRLVAIKVLFPEFATDPSFVERFRREAQSAANLNHPNIVSVYDWGRSNNTYFMAMEYIPGRTMAEALREIGQVSPDKAAEVGIEIASGLEFAHRNNVIHRDIKPGNILLGNNGSLKVADFGIARALGSAADNSLTQVGAVMGTAAYFSPEQAQGGQPDPRSDLYSLGVVLYEMVAGRPPFTGESPMAIAYKQVHEQPQPLNEIRPDVPRAFEAIVARLLAKDPSRRYPNAQAVRDDLRRFREGLPVQALAALINRRDGDPTPTAMDAPTAVIGETPLIGPDDAATIVQPATTVAAPRTDVTPEAGATMPLPRTIIVANPELAPGYTSDDGMTASGELQRRRRNIVIASVSAAMVLLIAAVVAVIALSGGGSTSTTFAIQSVTGLTLEEAVTTLEDAGLDVIPVAEETSTVDANVVWKQIPAPGEQVSEGDTVQVIYNPSNDPVPVPRLAGLTVEQARLALLDLGLTIGSITMQNDATVPENTIIATTPAEGEQVLGGATIDLIVSQGSGIVQIPNVQGQTSDAARSLLEGEPFDFIVSVVPEASETVEAGRVTRTSPNISSQTTKGSAVTLYVSTGQATIAVPPVTGITEAEARSALRGFIIRVEYIEVPSGSANDGLVIAQDPSAGVQIAPGGRILLKVGKAATPASTTTPATTTPATTTP
jgi:serine/threonine-protein kinase